jgi:serine/threonine-protein kinase
LDPKPSSTPPPLPSEGTLPKVDGDPLVGAVLLGRVRVQRFLARGGMGRVYVGEQVGLERPCAIKVLDPRLAASESSDFARRFLLEASVASKLTHPNVVTVFDYGETSDGHCFIAMEFLNGRTLADELKASGKLEPERALHVARQVCRALREAHALGVVHRDMKPGNVFLLKRDEDPDFAKVLDFGLVGEAHTPESGDVGHPAQSAIMGSPKYMAPEQVQGKSIDARADIYAVGAMLYAMLAGKPPFERATDLATAMAQVSDVPPPLATAAPGVVLPAGLEEVVMKCLAKNPDDRFASMDRLLVALKLTPGTLSLAESGPRAAPPLLAPPVVPTGLSTETSIIPAATKRGQAGPVFIGAACAIVVAGLVVASELRQRASTAAGGQPGAAPVMSAPQASATAAKPPPSAPAPQAKLHVETVPAGAKVKEEGETLCEATPCDITYSGEGASSTFEHLLVFMKPDYKLERKLAKADGSPVTVRLSKAK